MPDRLSRRMHYREFHATLLQVFQIVLRMTTSGFVPFAQASQFHSQYSRLQSVQTAVNALDLVRILLSATVVSQHSDSANQVLIVTYCCAAIAVRAQILSRIETETSCVSQGTHPAALPSGPVRLRRVLYD